LGLADKLVGQYAALKAGADNARTRAAHPHIAFPPPSLVYEVQSYARLDQFLATGAAHADVIAALIAQHAGLDGEDRRILEWGCGPGRILRPLGERAGARLHGCDPNPACVAAATAFAPAATIARSAFAPPAPYPSAHFDVVYGVSILTHMNAAAAAAWIVDIARLLKSGGVTILTTHGARHAGRLGGKDRTAFAAGAHVALGGAMQGSRAFSSYTPAAAMTAFAAAAGLDVRAHHERGPADVIGQDVWVMAKP
jgi:SAM-dependent methyltransferase